MKTCSGIEYSESFVDGTGSVKKKKKKSSLPNWDESTAFCRICEARSSISDGVKLGELIAAASIMLSHAANYMQLSVNVFKILI